VLPSEAELGRIHGVSRVTVRRALETLRAEGVVDSRQGFGWFAPAVPIAQDLSDGLGTIEAQLVDAGRAAERRVLDFGYLDAPAPIRERLGADHVLRVRRLDLADGEPFALVTVWCPVGFADHLSRADVERASFHGQLSVEVASASQTISAVAAPPSDAATLQVPVGSPLLRCVRVTNSIEGEPVLLSEQLFPAHLTELTIELEHLDHVSARTSLRLIEGG